MALPDGITTIKQVLPGFGTPTEYQYASAQNVPINATTTFTLTGFNNPLHSGEFRVRFTAMGASGQVTAIKVTGTDGTSTEVYMNGGTYAANDVPNVIGRFLSSLLITTITIAITMANAGAAGTADLEVAANN